MKKFSQVTEVRASHSDNSITQADISQYLSKLQKNLPYAVQKVLYLTQKYNITSAEDIEKIKTSSKGKLSSLVDELNIPSKDLEDLWSMIKSLKNDDKLLPQTMMKSTFDALMSGRLLVDDVLIDLTTKQGQNAVSRMYMPLVYKIVQQYVGRSRLGKDELISAGMMGLADAIKDWKPEPKDGETVVPFKTYASYRIKQQILNDMDEVGHSMSGTNWYATKKYGASMLDAISLDQLSTDNEMDMDRFSALGVEDKPERDEMKAWTKLYAAMEKVFSQRDMDVFYRYFGLNGRDREKSKAIAKSLNMSEGNIRNSIINKILKWLRENPKAVDIIDDIKDIYTESLMCEMIGMDKNQILETLSSNDVYILLEELTRWKNPNIFNKAFGDAVTKTPDSHVIVDALQGDFNSIDDILKKYKKSIITFLSYMYPTTSFGRMTDVGLLEYLQDIQNNYKKINKIK